MPRGVPISIMEEGMVKRKKLKKGIEEKKKSEKKIIIATIFFLIAISVGFTLFTTSNDNGENLKGESDFAVYYFYLRTCPNCQAVKPYMTYLESKYTQITFHKYDLKNNEGVKEFAFYSDMTNNPRGGVPFAVLAGDEGGEMMSFLGRIEVMELEKAICSKLGLPVPTKVYEMPAPLVEGCKECHIERNLPMPSTYSCEYCCHSNRF